MAGIPEARRGPALVALAEQGLVLQNLLPAAERIAVALEAMAGAREPAPRAGEDPRLSSLDRDW